MKKIILAVAAVAALAIPVALTSNSAGAAAGNSQVKCQNFGDENRCVAKDPDGINYIRIIDPTTGALIKHVQLSCADDETVHAFNFADTGIDHYRIRIADCTNATDTYTVHIPQQSAP